MNEQLTDHELLEAIERNTRAIVGLLELAYAEQIRAKLESVVSDPKKVAAYQSSLKENSSRQVATLAGASDKSVRDWWKEWSDLGLVEETTTAGRFQRKFDLRRYGVSVPRGPSGV